jgi:uncharacterized secreted protein with C-terminal beta-propeller domain
MTRRAARSLAALATALSAMVLLSSCTSGGHPSTFDEPGVPVGGLSLVAFDSCASLLDGVRAAARSAVGPYGFGGTMMPLESRAAAGTGSDSLAAPNAGSAPSGASGTYSTTNTHEAGVDEPDLVKTDGKRIVTVTGGVLRVVDAASRIVTGTLALTDGTGLRGQYGALQLLLAGDHALVLSRQNGIAADGVAGPGLVLVDITGTPRVLGRYLMDGYLLDARQIGTTARVVVRSVPRLEFPVPADSDDADRVAANQAVIDQAPIESWLPRYSIVDAAGRTTTGTVECSAVSRPADYSGTATLTVLTFDLAAPALGNGEPVTVVADGDTVYANGPSFYIADDQRWRITWGRTSRGAVAAPRASTQFYKFDISGPGKPRFTAAGEVDGWLLNQYAMSEWDGRLRVATTLDQPWDRSGSSESTVYVLGQDGSRLAQLGKVGGLGKGERIYAVRFVGTTGFVVTFRQTDPLYVVDLRDPAAPVLAGELTIDGYSAYLHPAGDGRLIGVGRDASEQGRVQGAQVSLFDVHDTARPARLARFTVDGARSEAEYDPHAFLYWPQTGLLVVPLYSYRLSGASAGVLVLSVHDASITKVGTLAHPAATGTVQPIERSLIIDRTLWTVSEGGLEANDLTTLAQLAWLPS